MTSCFSIVCMYVCVCVCVCVCVHEKCEESIRKRMCVFSLSLLSFPFSPFSHSLVSRYSHVCSPALQLQPGMRWISSVPSHSQHRQFHPFHIFKKVLCLFSVFLPFFHKINMPRFLSFILFSHQKTSRSLRPVSRRRSHRSHLGQLSFWRGDLAISFS